MLASPLIKNIKPTIKRFLRCFYKIITSYLNYIFKLVSCSKIMQLINYIQQLADYIMKNLSKGYTVDALRFSLMNQGY